MKISYKNKKLQKKTESYKTMKSSAGDNSTRKIVRALYELENANCLADIPHALMPHPLRGNFKGYFGVWIKHPYRLIFKPINKFSISDYSSITEIEITYLSYDYH